MGKVGKSLPRRTHEGGGISEFPVRQVLDGGDGVMSALLAATRFRVLVVAAFAVHGPSSSALGGPWFVAETWRSNEGGAGAAMCSVGVPPTKAR